MRTPIAVLAATSALILLGAGSFASGEEDIPPDPTPDTCDARTVAFHKTKAKGLARAIYAERKWKDSTPAKPGQHGWFRWHIDCLFQPKADRALRAFKVEQKAQFYRYRALRLATDEFGEKCGRFGWHAIPCYIVSCETGGTFSWDAYNESSGAKGRYQFLDTWTVPWPVNSFKDKLAHHRQAEELARDYGISGQWACA